MIVDIDCSKTINLIKSIALLEGCVATKE